MHSVPMCLLHCVTVSQLHSVTGFVLHCVTYRVPAALRDSVLAA